MSILATSYEVTSQTLTIDVKSSKTAHHHGVVISFREWDGENPRIVIGAPGQLNVIQVMQLGDAVLYETTSHGLIEARVTEIKATSVVLLFTRVSPRSGFAAGVANTDIQNSHFTSDEVKQIREGAAAINAAMANRLGLEPDKLDFLGRKLDEIIDASQRMGRKDWSMFVAGTMTNVIVGAAFAPHEAKALLLATNSALGWVFQNAIRLLAM